MPHAYNPDVPLETTSGGDPQDPGGTMTACREVQLMRLRANRPEMDRLAFVQTMRDARVSAGYTSRELSEILGVPRTEVEHWFRLDRYGNLPRPEIWPIIRDLLGIEGWDEVGTVIWTDCEYEMAGRAYLPDGVCPTILIGPRYVVIE